MRTTITDAAQPREIIGTPLPRVIEKDRDRLHPAHLTFIAASPLCLVATSASDGTCDVSPKGDRPASSTCSTTGRWRCLSVRATVEPTAT